MRYITFLLLSAFVCLPNALFSANQKNKVTIQQATVYLCGAELISTAKVNLQAGETEVVFSNIAGNVNQQSLNITADKEVVVQSSTFQNNYVETESMSPKAKSIKDTIEKIGIDTQMISDQINMLNEQMGIIKDNHKIAGDNNNLSVAELQKLLDFVSTRKMKLLTERTQLKNKKEKLIALLEKFEQQLQEEQQKEYQPGGLLNVRFYSRTAQSANVTITYVVPTAGWMPCYDFRVKDIASKVSLVYKANVFQNSGVKWDNVKLILSTGNPNESTQAPSINPWYLSVYVPPVNAPQQMGAMSTMSAMSTPVYAYKKGLVNLDYQGGSQGLAQSEAITSMDDYVAVDNAGIYTTYDIDIPYTIPADGQKHLVAIKTYMIPATYRYFAAPKWEKDVFLQARLTGWEQLNLIPAPTQIFYEGSYVGSGNLDKAAIGDTLTLSLGRDKKIIVKRDKDEHFHSTKMIGTNVKESYAFSINVHNTREQAIELFVVDQLPVSNDNEISIEDAKYGDAVLNEQTGELNWHLNINKNETKKLQLSFTVKYPKDKRIIGL
jgi:uncharacterized protein (TIGR02231 family)